MIVRLTVIGLLCCTPQLAQAKQPDFSGFYDVATMTPLERPKRFGKRKSFTRAEAERRAQSKAERKAYGDRSSDPNREAPPAGGDGSRGAAGNVGGYNSFWIDDGDSNFSINGEYRTSIIYQPDNGRMPRRLPASWQRMGKEFAGFGRKNDGEAWWLTLDGPGPFDDPESLSMSDRCLLGFGSTSGPPALPVLYNNVKRIVQTEDHFMILTEMVHDARIVRMNSEHIDAEIRSTLGDSIGWWEDDTLVIDTTNFNDKPSLMGASRHLHVIERISRLDDTTLLYHFKVDDPDSWAEPWQGEYPWPETDGVVYEYACHEGNYSMGNILRGARLLEREAMRANN